MYAGGADKTFPKKKHKSEPVPKIERIPVHVVAAPDVRMEEGSAIDQQSRMGRFGWFEVNTDIYYGIPYILRNSTKYFALQMILTNERLLELLSRLHQDVYKYYYSVTESATEVESLLLNEINRYHCECRFGKEDYAIGTPLIKHTDASALYEFVDTCYRKLTYCTKIISNKIGFLQFSFSDRYIPFVRRNDELYMPMMCFNDANGVNLEYLDGWDLEYLRFCCFYQNIWKPNGSSDIFAVVVKLSSLDDFLPTDYHYKTCWPPSQFHQLLRPVSSSPSMVGTPADRNNSSKRRRNTTENMQTATAAEYSKKYRFNIVNHRSDTIEGEPPKKIQKRSKSNGLNKYLRM